MTDSIPTEPAGIPPGVIPEVRVVLSLGANLGDRLSALQRAISVIGADPAVTVTAVSAVYETDPVGGPEQPDYLNAAVSLRTTLVPVEVLALAHLAEQELHRTREVRWGARSLDVDVIDYEGVVSDNPSLTLPHPRAEQRAFVLIPVADLDPHLSFAGATSTVSQLLAQLPTADVLGVRRRGDLTLRIDSGA